MKGILIIYVSAEQPTSEYLAMIRDQNQQLESDLNKDGYRLMYVPVQKESSHMELVTLGEGRRAAPIGKEEA